MDARSRSDRVELEADSIERDGEGEGEGALLQQDALLLLSSLGECDESGDGRSLLRIGDFE